MGASILLAGLPLVTNGRDPITERQLRTMAAEPDWNKQLEMWREIDV